MQIFDDEFVGGTIYSSVAPKAALIYKQTGNLRAVKILLGHTNMDSTVRYLGLDIEDALALAEGTEI